MSKEEDARRPESAGHHPDERAPPGGRLAFSSPMAAIVHLVRGLYVCVPRDAVEASGLYNTLLRSDDAAPVVEVLNGYRKRMPLPENIDSFTVPLAYGSDSDYFSKPNREQIVKAVYQMMAEVNSRRFPPSARG